MTRNTNPQQMKERLGGVASPSLLRRIKKGLAIGTIGLSGLAATAHAELIEYTFTSVQGESRTVPAEQNYVNPKGNIQFALSAGVDRRVRVSILDGKGKALSTATGKILGAEDRITAAGSRYYGELLTLPAPAAGLYTIQAEIMSADGKTSVQKDTYPFYVDTIKPVISGVITRDGVWPVNVFGSPPWGGSNKVYLPKISDTNSGLDKAFYVTIDKNKNRREVLAELDPKTGVSTIDIANAIKIMPTDKTEYQAGFRIYDKAGNFSEILSTTRLDNAVPEVWVEVQNSKTQVWEKYTSGMTVYRNPVKFRYTGHKKDHSAYNNTGYGFGVPVSSTTGDYVHWAYERAFPVTASTEYAVFTTTSGTYRTGAYSQLNLTLAPGVEKAPIILSQIDYKIAGKNWVTSNWLIETKPYKVEQIRFHVETRNFVQKITMSRGAGSCTVPIGASSCVIQPSNIGQSVGRGYEFWTPSASKIDGSLAVSGGHFYTRWDFNKPVIDRILHNAEAGTVTVQMNDPDVPITQGGFNDWDTRVFKLELKSAGETHTISSFKLTKISTTGREAEFNIKHLPDGLYTVTAVATDTFGNEGLLTNDKKIPLDNTSPQLSINVNNGEAIESLDEFEILLYDNIDTDPNLISILLQGGPANDLVKLSWRKINNGQFKLEYPIMFPSLVEGEEYTLTATGSDAHSNTISKSVSFKYSPKLMELAGGMDGKIYLPAVASNFKRNNGLSVISTEPIKLGEGEHVMGTYDVIVSSRSDSEVPVIINGRIIQPGDAATVAAQHDFSTTGGRIDIPVTAAENGKTGKAHILLTTSAPNSPVATVELIFWDAIVNLQSDSWTYRQVIDPLDIRALPAKGTMCRLSLSEPIAQKADPISDPVCLIEWTQMPDEAEIAAIKAESGSDRVVGLQGQAVRIGQQDIKYALYMYSGDSKIRVGGGSGAIDVVSAAGSITYEPTENLSEVFRKIQSMTLKLKQAEGPKCRLTNNAEEAIRYGASTTSSSKACYLEWMSYPSTLGVANTVDPMLYGYLNDHKKEEITWRLSIYSKGGTRVNLGSQTYEIDVINPPAPTISIDSKFKIGDNYVLPMNQTLLGYAAFEGEPADLFVGISKDGEQVEAEVFYSGWVRERNKVSRVLELDHDKGLYGSTVIGLKTYYDLLPDVGDEADLSVISVPSSSVEPNFAITNNKVLDTEILPLTVTMIDRNSYDRIYHSDYGQWSVALFQQVRSLRDGDKLVELTEAKITDENGQVSFDVDMSKVEGSGARVIAIATLIHDIPDYERVVESRPVFTTVLYGGEVEGNVTARRYSGESVYSAYFQFEPDRENTRAARALGDTRWSVSADDGGTWEEFEPGIRPIFARNFEKGIYQIKATSLNRFSGAEFTSAAIELIVYDKPYLELDGPRRLMVGDTANLKVIPYIHGEKRPLEDFVFKWSTDKGDTYTEGSNEYSVTQDEPGTFQLRVRVKEVDAPDDDPKAWTEMRINPRFYPVRGPKIGLRAPNKVEVGKEYTVFATARSRVPEMQGQIIGEFVMPDGTRHRGKELTYIPTKQEELDGRVSVSYEAWFEGFEKDGFSSRSTNMRVWEYVWPNFTIRPFGTIRFAPTKVQMSVVQENSATVLEKPEYTWSLPEGAEIIRQVGGRIEFMLNKGGDYEIAASISDARGHNSDVSLALNLEDAPAWEIEKEVTYSNESMREPVVVSYRPQFTGGHPLDRIVSKKFYVNGELFKEGGFTAKRELRAGKHTIAVEMESRYGQFARDEIEVDVIKNIPPVCSIELIDLDTKWRVVPECEDEDGIVRRLNWTSNGVESGSSKYKTYIKSRIRENIEVTIVAVDDSGDESEPRSVTLEASDPTIAEDGPAEEDEQQNT